MRTVKFVCGIVCLVAALLLGLVVFDRYKWNCLSDLPLAVGTFWLAGIGCLFITRRIVPMSGTVRTLFALNFCLCAGFIVVVGFPNFTRTRYHSAANGCINNLRQIDAAVQEFALENHRTNGEAINYPNDLTPYIKLNTNGDIPPCPQGGVYSIKKVGDAPICSLGTTVTPAHVLP